jgi:4-amino-4-deoxy-L-arabinose transferase-like glycosyltransferase
VQAGNSDKAFAARGTSPLMTAEYPKSQVRSRTWFFGGLILVFFRALPNLRYPIGRDQATFCLIGQGLLHGQMLYRDLWDNKPPGIFYIYAVIVKVFGPVMWSVGAVDILWLLAISICIFYFARRSMGTPAAALAMVFNAARHCRQGYIHAAQPETFLMLCVFGAYFLLSAERGRNPFRLFLAGLTLGAAFWLKYNAVAFFPVVALVPFLDFTDLNKVASRIRMTISWRDWLSRMAVVAGGFVFAVAGVLIYFWISGALPALKEVQFEVLPRYGAMAFEITTNNFLLWALRETQIQLDIWYEAIASLALLIAWRRREVGAIAPAALFALAGYISVAMQLRFHHPYYYEACYPFFAMFWGYVCVKTYEAFQYLQRTLKDRNLNLARGLLWLVLVGLAASLLPEESVRVLQQYSFMRDWWRNPEQSYSVYYWELPLDKLHDQMRVLDFLRVNSQPQDEVYVWGTAPLINFLGRRRTPSRFVSNLALISLWAPDRWRQELADTLEAKRPRYIVVIRDDAIPTVSFTGLDSEQYLRVYPSLAGVLDRDYQADVRLGDFHIYRLK